MMRKDRWNRCDVCGRFIAFRDFTRGACRVLFTFDSDFSKESYKTLCIVHNIKR